MLKGVKKRKLRKDLPAEIVKTSEELIAELNNKQKAFCREYCMHWNGKKAYHTAYTDITEDTAKVNASKLLTKTNIQAYIKYIKEHIEEAVGISKQKVLNELDKIAFSKPCETNETWFKLKDFNKLTSEQRSCISEISTEIRKVWSKEQEKEIQVPFVKIRFFNKIDAIKEINKMLGYNLPDKIEGKFQFEGDINITYK